MRVRFIDSKEREIAFVRSEFLSIGWLKPGPLARHFWRFVGRRGIWKVVNVSLQEELPNIHCALVTVVPISADEALALSLEPSSPTPPPES